MRLGLLLGVLNAVVAVAVLALCERFRPLSSYGWFAYAPLEDVHFAVQRSFPWAFVAVPASLVVLNVLAALALRTSLSGDGRAR